MGMSWVVMKGSVSCRRSCSKDLGLGPHFTVIYEPYDLEQIIYLLIPHLYTGRVVPTNREAVRFCGARGWEIAGFIKTNPAVRSRWGSRRE